MTKGNRDKWRSTIVRYAGEDACKLECSQDFVFESLHAVDRSIRSAALFAGYAWWHLEDFPEYRRNVARILRDEFDDSWNSACSIASIAYAGLRIRDVLAALAQAALCNTRVHLQRNEAYRTCHLVWDDSMYIWASDLLAKDIKDAIVGGEQAIELMRMDIDFLKQFV